MNVTSRINTTSRRTGALIAAASLALPLVLAGAPAATADRGHRPGQGHRHDRPADDARKLAAKLVGKSSARDAYRHLRALQTIADRHEGHRAAGSPGHEASAEYVGTLLKSAGYKVSYQTFDFVYTETLAQKLSVLSPSPRELDLRAMSYTRSTPEGGIEAALANVPVDADATSGCEAADYGTSGAYAGKIAVIRRGGCSFAIKQALAADAGAAGAVIYNNEDGELSGTLGSADAARIPTGGLTRAEGEALAAEVAKGTVTVRFDVRELQEPRKTRNVVAETRGGSAARTVMLGSHLDSVTEGPGINDNGSGSAGLLEVALDLARTPGQPRNKVRFAWWSAEENGLLGSEAYVAALGPAQREAIALYLNFDMIASPNPVQLVYDGDDSDAEGEGPGPEGSAQLERDINRYLDGRRSPHEGTDFDGRSDYGPFIEAGIPAGGTFTGAEGVKTEAQAKKYGGTAGLAYDPCYHAACDTLKNLDMKAFDLNIDVIAHAVGTYAHDLSSLRPAKGATATPAPPTRAGATNAAPDEPRKR